MFEPFKIHPAVWGDAYIFLGVPTHSPAPRGRQAPSRHRGRPGALWVRSGPSGLSLPFLPFTRHGGRVLTLSLGTRPERALAVRSYRDCTAFRMLWSSSLPSLGAGRPARRSPSAAPAPHAQDAPGVTVQRRSATLCHHAPAAGRSGQCLEKVVAHLFLLLAAFG